jgi:molybdopterin molybdotransferase
MLVPLTEARRRIARARFHRPRIVSVPVLRSVGKLAAARERAANAIPARKVSAMDGYALRVGPSVTMGPFTIRGASFPSGRPSRTALRSGEASYIATGAALPPAANAVVRVEAARREENLLFLRHSVSVGEDVIFPGESMKPGDLLLEQGQPIAPVHVGALVAQRIRSVPVFWIRAAVLPIGDELARADSDSSRWTPDFLGPIVSGLASFAQVELLPPVGDDRDEVARILSGACRRSDLVLTIGGSSAGNRDVTKPALAQTGTLLFEGVATNVLKRGAVGFAAGTPVIVLPGQLVSCVTVYHEHALHVISRMVGRELRLYEEVALAEGISVDHRMDTTYLFRVANGLATSLPWGVARMTALLRAQAFGILAHGRRYRAGEKIQVQRLWALR